MNRIKGQSQQPLPLQGKSGIAAAAAGSLCILLAAPVSAVELGDIRVESGLGQPLRASIAYALGPNEQLASQCVYLRSGMPETGIPTVTRATATLSGNRIVLRGDVPLREPMMGLQLVIDCPYTANLQRDFTLLLNPAGMQSTPEPVAAPAAVQRPAAPTRSNLNRVTRATSSAAPVVSGAEYRVRTGDTLSEIVSRIEGRTQTLWPAVEAVFAANPNAFSNGDMNRIIAGSTIVIPASVTGGQAAPAAVAAVPVEAVQQQPVMNQRAYGGAGEGVPASPTDSAPAYVDVVAAVRARNAAAETVSPAPAETAEPDATVPVSPAEPATPAPVVSIPDTRIVQQQPVVQTPDAEPVPIGDLDSNGGTGSWLVWLGGSGVAIFIGLLLFGRRLRDRLTPNPDLDETQINEELFNRRSSDRGEQEPESDLGFADTMTNANPVEVAEAAPQPTDFDTGDDVDVALDYSFSSTGDYGDDVDLLLEEGGDSDAETGSVTAEIPSQDDDTVEETGYDMSMVVDVTKQDFGGADATAKDLQAFEVQKQIPGSRSLDLTTEFDYKILEQDYEEELTATQALNKEIAAAALELQDRLNEFDEDPTEVSMAEDLDGTAEVTAEMPARALDAEDSADVGDSLTAKLPEGDGDYDFGDPDATVEHRPKKTG